MGDASHGNDVAQSAPGAAARLHENNLPLAYRTLFLVIAAGESGETWPLLAHPAWTCDIQPCAVAT